MFIITQPGSKLHYAIDETVAVATAQDLEQRFGDPARISSYKEESEGNPYRLDFGGSVLSSWKSVEINVNGLTFLFWPHQFYDVEFYLNKALKDLRANNDVEYVKLHSVWNCICLSVPMAMAINADIKANREIYKASCEKAMAEWEIGLDSLRAEPHPNVLIPKKKKLELLN